ncbi:MAG: carbohydrate kinase [Chloroflexi bacterium]|nr:carbohydrate kinase [Chloroflexota bacterium]
MQEQRGLPVATGTAVPAADGEILPVPRSLGGSRHRRTGGAGGPARQHAPATSAGRPLVVALDIGSSSVRAGLFAADGRPVDGCHVQLGYAWETGRDGGVTIAAERLLDLTASVLDGLVARAGDLLADAVAGGISCFFHSLIGLDGQGRPLTPLHSWADTSAAAEAALLARAVDPPTLLQLTGAPLHAGYWPARIRRLRAANPAVRSWAGFPELLLERLTGEAPIGMTMASGTGLFDRRTDRWAIDLLDLLGLDERELPAIVDDDRPIGHLRAAAALRWPALAHVAWFPAWGDGACGNVGLGCTAPDRAALMIGTSGALRVLLPEPAAPIPAGLFGYRLGRDRSLLGGQLSEGGGVVAALAKLLRRSPAALQREAALLEPAAGELSVLPFLAGERGVGYHDTARGALAGLRLDTSAAEIYRGFLEAIAFRFAEVDERLTRALSRPAHVTAAGGALRRSPLWVGIIADVLGRPVEMSLVWEASSRGAALLALAGCGAITDVASVAPPPSRQVQADPARHARYLEARGRQAELYRRLIDAPGPSRGRGAAR